MEFDVEIVLRDTNQAVTERIEHGTEPRAWRELDVETVLKEILLAIDRVKNPSAVGRHVGRPGDRRAIRGSGPQRLSRGAGSALEAHCPAVCPRRSAVRPARTRHSAARRL